MLMVHVNDSKCVSPWFSALLSNHTANIAARRLVLATHAAINGFMEIVKVRRLLQVAGNSSHMCWEAPLDWSWVAVRAL